MIPTEPIGSIPRPPTLIDAVAQRGGKTDDAALTPLFDDAVRDTITRFEATGSPVITDGEQRKYHNFWDYCVHGLEEGKVDVIVRRARSHVELVVHDNGIGIRPEFLPHVFDRFRQEDASTTRRFGGLGLGLSIVKQLVEIHGGSVEVTSKGEGHGATFTVTLPLRPIDEKLRAAGKDESAPRLSADDFSLAGLDVLVVDDAADARELLAVALSEAGASVRTAASANEALASLQAAPPHVVVSDIGMPERDCYDLMRDIRALPADQGGRTPAIALTRSPAAKTARARSAGRAGLRDGRRRQRRASSALIKSIYRRVTNDDAPSTGDAEK